MIHTARAAQQSVVASSDGKSMFPRAARIFVDSRAPQDDLGRLRGRQGARGHRGPLRPRRPRRPGAAAAPAPQAPPAGLHGRGQLDDRQPAPAGPLRRAGPGQRRPAVRRRRPRVRGGGGAGPGGVQPLRPPRQRGRAPPGPELRAGGVQRRLLQGLLVAAGLRGLPARAQAAAQDHRPAVPVLRAVPGRLAGQRARRPPGQRGKGGRAAGRPVGQDPAHPRLPGEAGALP